MEQSPSWAASRLSASQGNPLFYETRMFITAFTSSRHLSLSSASSIRSVPPHSASWGPILILSFHLRLGLPSGFHTKTLLLWRQKQGTQKVFHSLYFPPIFVPVCPLDPNLTLYAIQLTQFLRFLTCVCTLRCLNCDSSSFSNNSDRLIELWQVK